MSTFPIPKSRVMDGLRYTGRMTRQTFADTWYPSWAADGNLYTCVTDGAVQGQAYGGFWPSAQHFDRGVDDHRRGGFGHVAVLGSARLKGEDPFALEVELREPLLYHTPRFHGQYPCISLYHRGVWYYGSYYLHRWINALGQKIIFELGPFAGFRLSLDDGKSWQPPVCDDQHLLFPGRGRAAGELPVRLGAPHLVDHGQENRHAPDGKLYIIGHGSSDPNGVAGWLGGDEIHLARVELSLEKVNDPQAWEFAAFDAQGKGTWTHDYARMQPLIRWPGKCGVVNVTYVPWLKRYVMMVTNGPPDGGENHYDTWIAEAERLQGPWSMVDYWKEFGSRGYFVCMPSKFIHENDAHLTLFWSANWQMPGAVEGAMYERVPPYENPPGSGYGLCVGEFELGIKRGIK